MLKTYNYIGGKSSTLDPVPIHLLKYLLIFEIEGNLRCVIKLFGHLMYLTGLI